MKERLEKLFKLSNVGFKVSELIKSLKITVKEEQELINTLYELELEGKIFFNSDNRYIHTFKESYLIHGKLINSNKGHYYIEYGKQIINITNKQIREFQKKNNEVVLAGDYIWVEIDKEAKLKHPLLREGVIKRKIVKTNLEETDRFCKVELKKKYKRGYSYVVIDDVEFIISNFNLNGAQPGDIVSVHIRGSKVARVIDVIKRKNDSLILECRRDNDRLVWVTSDNPENIIDVYIPSSVTFNVKDRILITFENNKAIFSKKLEPVTNIKDTVTAMIYNTGIPVEFSIEALKELREICNVTEEDYKNRVDFRNLTTVTIDGSHAKDFDDAISLVRDEDSYTLYVHIADVTHFVKPGSQLFEEAYIRSSSIYPSSYVFPMLPPELSNGLCSLNPNEDKLTKTYILKYDLSGNLLDANIVNSVIRSNKRMNYSSVNEVLSNSSVPEGYEDYVGLLQEMNGLSKLLQAKKIKRGALCVRSTEYEFEMDNNEVIEGIEERKFGDAELLIENFMLAANTATAEYAKYLGVPFIFRNHEEIDSIQYEKLKSYFKTIKLPRRFSIRALTNYIGKLNETNAYEAIYVSSKALSCMNRAYYAATCDGHFGLALNYYATISSPIRKFTDLCNEYVIGEIIEGRIEGLDSTFKNIEKICEHATETQNAIDEIEKKVSIMMLNKYASKFIDCEFDAEILFIKQDYVGMLTQNQLYGFTTARIEDRGNTVNINGRIYSQGDHVKIKIVGVCDSTNQLQFEIVSKIKDKEKVKKKGRRL